MCEERCVLKTNAASFDLAFCHDVQEFVRRSQRKRRPCLWLQLMLRCWTQSSPSNRLEICNRVGILSHVCFPIYPRRQLAPDEIQLGTVAKANDELFVVFRSGCTFRPRAAAAAASASPVVATLTASPGAPAARDLTRELAEV
jgi:hypothetical protein